MRLNRKTSLFVILLLVVFVSLPAAYQARPAFPVTLVCLQDDSSPGIQLQWDISSGAYTFCCGGTTFTGFGVVTRRGSTFSLQAYGPNRRVTAVFDGAVNRGSAALQILPGGGVCTITDRNTTNDSCTCGSSS